MSEEDDYQKTPDIVRDDLASRRSIPASRSGSVKHFLPQTDNSAYYEKYRNTHKPLSWQEIEKARQEEFQNEEEIANSLEAWKERRKQKSLKQREAIGQATFQAREFVPSYEKKDIGLGRTSKYQELAARYSDTADGPESPRVLDENFDDSQNFDNIQNPINFEDSKKSEENSVGDSESSSQTDESQIEINQQPQIDNKMPIRQNNYQCFTIPVDKSVYAAVAAAT